MTKKGKNIDDFFKEKLSGYEFPFKPEYWLKMESLIGKIPAGSIPGAASKILGLAKWKFISLISSLIVVSSVSIYFISHETTNPGNESIANHPTTETIVNDTEVHEIPDNPISETTTATPTVSQPAVAKTIVAKPWKTKEKIAPDTNSNTVSNTIEDKTISILNNPGNITNNTLSNSQESEPEPPKTITETEQIQVNSVNSDTIDKTDSSVAIQNPANNNLDLTEFNRFSIIGGTTLSRTFANSGSIASKYSFAPSVGIGYHLHLNEYSDLAVSLYWTQSRNNSLERYSVRTRYSMFKEIDSIYLLTQQIDFLNFNLDYRMQFLPGHFISGGVFSAFRLNTHSSLTHVVKNPFYYLSERTLEKGYFEGIRTINMGVSATYEYRFINNAFLGLRYNFSINDLIDNKIYLHEKTDHISQFNLYLKWMLF